MNRPMGIRTDVHTRPAQFRELLDAVGVRTCISVKFRPEIALS